MKILLLGEYSGVHSNLKRALLRLGHDVVMASDGDSFKSFSREIDLKGYGANKFTRTISRVVNEFKAIDKISGFDVVQIINPLIFSQFTPEKYFFKQIIRTNKKVFLTALGDDYYFWKAFRENKFRYTPLDGYLKVDIKQNKSNWEYGRLKDLTEFLSHEVNAVIPCAYTYHVGYETAEVDLTNTIPFPIEIGEITMSPSSVGNGKIKFLHGIQTKRMGFKGSHLVNEAMGKLQDRYPDLVEYIVVRDMPYEDYLKVLQTATVVIDQVNSYEPAMNALISMAMGKVVMGGCEPEWMRHIGLNYEPLINILPDVNDIYQQGERLVLNPDLISVYSINARRFVEDYHDSNKVAKQFVEIWSA